MKKAGRMKLDEFHVGDNRAGAPCHRDAIAGRDRRVGRVEINLAATPGGEDQPVGADGFHHAGNFIEHINSEAMILGGKAKFGRGDQIDRHVIFEQLNVRRTLDRAQQRGSRSRSR